MSASVVTLPGNRMGFQLQGGGTVLVTRGDPWSQPALLPQELPRQGCLEVPQLLLEGRELSLDESFRLFNP